MNCFDPRCPLGVKGQGQTLKSLKSNISKTVRDREMLSIAVKKEIIYELSNGINCFDPRCFLGVKGQGRTLKTLKSNISKTVRDREMLSIEVK